MAVENNEVYQVWAMRLSIFTTIVVVLLSWNNGLKVLDLIVRAGVSFGVMYLLTVGSLSLFERTAPQKPQSIQADLDPSRGGNIDFTLGDDELIGDDELLGSPGQDTKFPGQIGRDLSSGLPGSERQAEIVRRMGWE